MALKTFLGREDDLQAELDQLAEREALKSDLIRMAAHGLRNPLALVMGYTEILANESGDLSEVQRTYVQGIQNASARMNRIIETVLSLERLEEFENEAVRLPVDLAALLRNVIAEEQPTAARGAVQIEHHLAEAAVTGDAVQLFEAMANVVGNAVKYTPSGGTVTITLKQKPGLACVTVSDTGIGIPKNEHARIFEPFFRAHGAAENSIDGMGLGLYLVRRIVERHGGQISLHSLPGKGSSFTIELPVL